MNLWFSSFSKWAISEKNKNSLFFICLYFSHLCLQVGIVFSFVFWNVATRWRPAAKRRFCACLRDLSPKACDLGIRMRRTNSGGRGKPRQEGQKKTGGRAGRHDYRGLSISLSSIISICCWSTRMINYGFSVDFCIEWSFSCRVEQKDVFQIFVSWIVKLLYCSLRHLVGVYSNYQTWTFSRFNSINK